MTGNRRQLGRGLSALLGTDGPEAPADERARPSRTVPVELLRPGRFQPRRRFDAEAIEALRSEEHTYELQSLMRKAYSVCCLKTQICTQRKSTEFVIDNTDTETIYPLQYTP